jgi:hypothetical protein
MDLRRLVAVLKRFWVLVTLGAVVSVALAAFALVRVDPANGRVQYRSQEQWVSYARIFITQKGFPYGQTESSGQANTAGLAPNAVLYSQLATSDAVKSLAFGAAGVGGEVEAAPVLASTSSSDALPIISIAGIGDTPAKAKDIARRETRGLITYIADQQTRAGIDDNTRVVLQIVQQPRYAALLKGRSKTLGILAFMISMTAVIGLAFVLENLRPRAPRAPLAPTSATA